MKYTENTLNILTARHFKGIGDVWINKNLTVPLPYEAIVDLLRNDKKVKEEVSEEIFLTIRENIKQNLTRLENVCDGIVAIGDPKFPKWRGNVKDADKPNVLFYRGDLGLLSLENKNIAVIGVLDPDHETKVDERKIVHQLVQQDAVIVSGLALGCDSIAHEQAIKSQGVTVAILPSSLEKIIPKQNKELADEIVDTGGLLITEYYDEPKSAQDLARRYIERDRLQALFSDIVLLSASYVPESIDSRSEKIDSGSRHAMEKAKEYGIFRAVIYNPKYQNNPKYDLNRQIMDNDRTIVVIDPENISSTMVRLFTNTINKDLVNDDLFSEALEKENKVKTLFQTHLDGNKLILSKGNDNFSISLNNNVLNPMSELIEYYLNNDLYSVTIHNQTGFVKCFTDKEKQDYIMAIKVADIKTENEKSLFLNFFSDASF